MGPDFPPTLVRVGEFDPIEEADGDEIASAGFSFTSGAISLNQRADAKILSPINEPVFIPNHCVSIAQGGNLDLGPEDNADVRLRGGALAWARYATSPGLANPPSDTNEYATMEVVFHFLGVGMDCSNFTFTAINNFFPGQLFHGFRQRIVVGDTDVGVCLLYTSPSPRDQRGSRMPSSA